jgi:transposase InsO family protein
MQRQGWYIFDYRKEMKILDEEDSKKNYVQQKLDFQSSKTSQQYTNKTNHDQQTIMNNLHQNTNFNRQIMAKKVQYIDLSNSQNDSDDETTVKCESIQTMMSKQALLQKEIIELRLQFTKVFESNAVNMPDKKARTERLLDQIMRLEEQLVGIQSKNSSVRNGSVRDDFDINEEENDLVYENFDSQAADDRSNYGGSQQSRSRKEKSTKLQSYDSEEYDRSNVKLSPNRKESTQSGLREQYPHTDASPLNSNSNGGGLLYTSTKLTKDQLGESDYEWAAASETTIIADAAASMADYFKTVKHPYNFNMNDWQRLTCRIKSDWYLSFKHKYDPPKTEVHSSLNRFRDLAMTQNRHIHEWGTQLYNGIIFDLKAEELTKFEQMRELHLTQFREPGRVNKDDLQGVCRWIEGMYREILKKYRRPITSDSAADWLQNAKMTTTDFRGLHALVDSIRSYAAYLDTSIKVNESYILKYVKRALVNTDKARNTSRNDMQSLESRFRLQYNLYVKSANETEEQQRAALDNTCNSLVNLLESEKIERIGESNRSTDNDRLNNNNKPKYDNKRNYNPTMRHNAFMERQLAVDNEDDDQNENGTDNNYYGEGQSIYSQQSVNSSYENQNDQYKVWSEEEMRNWYDRMETFTNDAIMIQEYNVLTENQARVASELGTGRPHTALSKYGDKEGMLCIACGDERHDVEHCYSATADGNLSLASLAFLSEEESDKKLMTAQKDCCALAGQSTDVIETIRSIVARIRKNLTSADRKKNMQNKRDYKQQKMSEMRNNVVSKSSPARPTKLTTVQGQQGKLRITEEHASIKSLRAIQQIGLERQSLTDQLDKLKLEESDERMQVAHNEIQHDGVGLLLFHNKIFVTPQSTVAINGVDTAGISEELLRGETVSNDCLVFLNFSVRGVTHKDTAFIEIEKYKQWVKDTSKEIGNKARTEFVIQMDNGGARTVASRAFADHCNAPVLKLSDPVNLMAFNKSITPVEHYAVFVIAVKGIMKTLDEGYQTRTREFRVTALITDTEQPLILGSEVIEQQNIVFLPNEKRARIFADSKHELIVNMVPWTDMKEKLSTSTIQRSFKFTTDVPVKDVKMSLLREFKLPETQQEIQKMLQRRITKISEYEEMDYLIRSIQTDPEKVVNAIQQPYERWMVVAIMIFNIHIKNFSLDYYAGKLRETLYWFNRSRWYTDKEVKSKRLQLPQTKNNIRFTKDMILAHIKSKGPVITLNTMSEVSDLASAIAKEQDEEVILTQETLTAIRNEFMKKVDESMRPAEFPVELWTNVFDEQKPFVAERFRKLREHPAYDTLTMLKNRTCESAPLDESKLPKNRLEEVLQRLMKIDISTETPARATEKDYLLAQCIANIDRFGHPNPMSPAKAEGNTFSIDLIDKRLPPCFRRSKKLAYPMYWSLRRRVEYMLERGEIKESISSWNSPPNMIPQPEKIQEFMTKHKDKATERMAQPEYAEEVRVLYRFTSDLRCVNERTKLEIHPLPLISSLIDRTRGGDRYSGFDIEDAFFTMLMDILSGSYTAFSAVDKHYEYKVMPMGAKNAASHFASMVEDGFGPIRDNTEFPDEKMFVYQDDILNHSHKLRDHLLLQQKIYDRMRKLQLIFKISKSHINYKQQRVLGHILTKDGRFPDPSLTDTITKLATPVNLKEIQSLLGLAQVAREYIPALTTLLEPIQRLTKKGTDIVKSWGKEQEETFRVLKEILTTKPVLLIPDISKPFRVHVDACRVGKGIGAVLLQLNDVEEYQPVAYWSRALSAPERNYSATELECTALHDTIIHWQPYLMNGIEFEVLVDHYALIYMVTKAGGAESQQRLLRLCLDLQQFTFKVTHRKGIHHIDADAVSRLLGKDDVPYVRSANELCDDKEPLTASELQYIRRAYGEKDAAFMIPILEEGRKNSEPKKLGQLRAKKGVKAIVQVAETLQEQNDLVMKAFIQIPLEEFMERIRAMEVLRHEMNQAEKVTDLANKERNVLLTPIAKLSSITIKTNQFEYDSHNEIDFVEDGDYIHDKKWLRCQEIGWHELESRKFKRLPQISSATLERFLKENEVEVRTKKLIKWELLKRRRTREISNEMKQYRQAWPSTNLNSKMDIKEKKTWFDVRGRAELKYDKEYREYCEQLREEGKKLLGLVHERMLALYPRLMTYKIRTRLQEDNLIRVDELVDLKKDKVLQELSKVTARPKSERIRALQTIHEKEKKWTLEQELVDKKDRLLQREAKRQAKLTDYVEEGVPVKKRGRPKRVIEEEKEIEITEFNIGRTLEQYDKLVHQCYYGENGQLYEVINVYSDKETGKFMSTARGIVPQGVVAMVENDKRSINGTDGTMEKVNLMLTGRRSRVEDSWPIDVKEWVKFQNDDEWCRSMKVKLEDKDTKVPIITGAVINGKTDYYYMDSEVLKRCSFRTIEKMHNDTKVTLVRTLQQIIVPKQLRQACMYLLHDQLGHPGRERTLDTIKLNYQWIGIGEDVKQYVKDCRFCKLRKVDNFRAKVPIQEYNRMGRPLDRVHADLAGPFQPTEGTMYVYILIIKDALTKFLILVPLADKTAETVTRAFTTQVLNHYGPPKMLITDKGTDFVNKQMRHWCKMVGTDKKNTTPANPRADGLAENAVKTVKDMLVSYINVFQTNWDKYLPLIQYDYNTTVNIATGYEPYFLMFGRTANRVDETLTEEVLNMQGVEEYGVQFSDVMEWIWKNVGDRVVQNSKVMKERQHPATHLQFKEYEVGDYFYHRRIAKRFYKDDLDEKIYKLNAKLQYRWTGPFRIIKKILPVLYEADIHNKITIVHAVNMRPF